MASRQSELSQTGLAKMISLFSALSVLLLALAVSGCASVDLRGQGITNATGTGSPGTESRQAPAPETAAPLAEPEDSIITFDGRRYVEAQEGDTPESVASRHKVDLEEFSSLNYLLAGVPIQSGRMLELPPDDDRPGSSRISEIASQAIGSQAAENSAASGGEVVQSPQPNQLVHIVRPGETAYSIAADYEISVLALVEWNALEPPDFRVRVNQRLLIPRIASVPTEASSPAAPSPKQASTELPSQTPSESAAPPKRTVSELSANAESGEPETPAPSTASSTPASPQFMMPMEGEIVLGYSSEPGGNPGINIYAPEGTPVVAAGDGEVSIVSPRDNETVIMLIRHDQNIHTVYTNLTGVTLAKDDKVSKGQIIGRIAGEGRNVLHFEIRIGTRAEDPMPYLSSNDS